MAPNSSQNSSLYLFTPLADAYGLLMHRNGQWEWTLAPGVSPSPRYQHAAVFVGARLHVTGGALRGGRAIEGEAAVAVLDTAAGVWLDRNGLVTSPRTNKGHTEYDPSLELMRRCRHAAASVGVRIYIYGGLKGDMLLDDFLIAENSAFQSDINSPILTSDRAATITSPKLNQSNANLYGTTPTPDGRLEVPSSGAASMDKSSMEKLAEASAAEAEAVSAVWQAMQAASAVPSDETSVSDDNSQAAETTSDGSDTEADVRLHPRAVVVAKEAVGNLGGMIISTLLRPRNWKAPANRRFFLDSYEVGELCYAAEQIFMHEPTVLQLKAPIKVFGDLHGQFGDLMRLFDEYGFPSTAGDITLLFARAKRGGPQHQGSIHLKQGFPWQVELKILKGERLPLETGCSGEVLERRYIDYLFLGDYVDRGQHSLETITLLLALKAILWLHNPITVALKCIVPFVLPCCSFIVILQIEYPENVHLIRGNHEAADINALFGFRLECIERMGESDGIWAWTRFNQLFNFLPLAALIEKKIICMHGGIGRSISSVEQIEKLERPITMDAGSIILMDLLWSDPTENDSIEGLRPNARGPGLVTFGGLVVVPKLIHPLPPPLQSPETSPERTVDDTWMQELNIQRPPTPTRGRPQPDLDRNSLAYI
ncbi:Serine/threonine-protein phosphatase BSL1 [Vitis vinifera]|uniref:Serine/threonine-protein phosphatase n=1 Tax=Vitis vinifera TaxID=29760 RepID=A0A438KHZ2_VITVI|nr:Serine/threonine-protein phosphatase BSL1 [Vitis vinifera]